MTSCGDLGVDLGFRASGSSATRFTRRRHVALYLILTPALTRDLTVTTHQMRPLRVAARGYREQRPPVAGAAHEPLTRCRAGTLHRANRHATTSSDDHEEMTVEYTTVGLPDAASLTSRTPLAIIKQYLDSQRRPEDHPDSSRP